VSDTTTTKTRTNTSEGTFSEAEKAAMKEAAKERKAASKRKGKDFRAEGEAEIQAKVAEMPEADRAMAERIHAIVKANAPSLSPRTWYGMPAYAHDGKVLCFFKAASKFGARYATLGFTDIAALDDGDMWSTEFALTALTPDVAARIAALVKKAVS
jgi:uncharacterized protein YdhG (YjbR/CyaY superfamily)